MVPPSDVVLEINGLAARDGWSISAEGELDSSRKPDLLLTQLGRRFVVEVTIQGLSTVMRQAESFGDVLSSLTFAVEHEFGVASHIQAARVVDSSAIDKWAEEFRKVAAQVADDGGTRMLEIHGIQTRDIPADQNGGRTFDVRSTGLLSQRMPGPALLFD